MLELRPPGPADYAKLWLLAGIWGSSFMSIEVALTALPPLVIASGRLLLAALAMTIALRLLGLRLPPLSREGGRDWALCLLIGLFNSALPFALISWGQQFISSGRTAILIACGPFLALTLAHWFTHDDRLTTGKLIGVSLGFSGVLALIGTDALQGENDAVIGQLAVALAALCYAVSSLLTRRLSHLPSLVSSAGTLITGALISLPTLTLTSLPQNLNWAEHWPAAAALLWLGLSATALAYLLRVQLIQRIGTTFMSQVAYLIPLFAVFWGWLFLDERPAASAWLALGLILAGMAASRLPGREIGR